MEWHCVIAIRGSFRTLRGRTFGGCRRMGSGLRRIVLFVCTYHVTFPVINTVDSTGVP